jgi:hypothetical protein
VMLAAAGMSSKDIAERLYLSIRTVNNHLQHAYTKLGISSRAGLANALGSNSRRPSRSPWCSRLSSALARSSRPWPPGSTRSCSGGTRR